MQRADFVGTWALVSWSATDNDGQQSQPYGDAPHGYIIYTADGYMSAQIQGNGGDGVTGDGLFLAYSGEFLLDGETAIHRVKFANWPPIVGSDQRRDATFNGDQLVLSATAKGTTHTISWKRAGRR